MKADWIWTTMEFSSLRGSPMIARPSAFALDVGDAVVEGVAPQQGPVESCP